MKGKRKSKKSQKLAKAKKNLKRIQGVIGPYTEESTPTETSTMGKWKPSSPNIV